MRIEKTALQADQLKMAQALDAAVAETQAVVQSAIDGALTRRITMTGKSGQSSACDQRQFAH